MLQKFAMDKDVFRNPLISLQLLQLRLLGYVYPVDDCFKIFNFVRGIISTAILCITAVAQLSGTWLHYDNLNVSIQMFAASATYINIVTRTFVFYIRNKEYKSLINNVEIGSKNVFLTSLPAEMKIYNQYRKYITVLTYSLWITSLPVIIYVFSEASYFLKFHYDERALLQGSNMTASMRLPFLYVLYPLQNIASNYYVAFISPFGVVVVALIALMGWHSFNASLMRYISFRLDIFEYKVSNIQEYVDFILRRLDLPVGSQKCAEKTNRIWRYVFISCIKDYHDIKSFAMEYENVTSATVFAESLTITTPLCVILYMMSKDISAGYGIYEIWCMLTLQILWVYYWHGNEILTKSNQITTAIYFQNWYDLPVPIQKDTLLLMAATMEPIILKAGFIHMNTASFVMILKTSYSYLMVLRSFAE